MNKERQNKREKWETWVVKKEKYVKKERGEERIEMENHKRHESRTKGASDVGKVKQRR